MPKRNQRIVTDKVLLVVRFHRYGCIVVKNDASMQQKSCKYHFQTKSKSYDFSTPHEHLLFSYRQSSKVAASTAVELPPDVSSAKSEMKMVTSLDMCNFLKSLGNNRGRLIGLDVGKVSIGVAKSDQHLQVAEPLSSIVEDFLNGLANTGEFSHVKMCWWDEVGTTQNARLMLDHVKISHAKRKYIGDKLAAVGILQGFLDFYNNPGSKPWKGVIESDSGTDD